MEQRDFMTRAKQLVVDYFNSHVDATDGKKLTMEDAFIVWFSKTLQNWKALVSTTVSDGMYYEITHNGDKKETYLDVYKKWENQCIAEAGLQQGYTAAPRNRGFDFDDALATNVDGQQVRATRAGDITLDGMKIVPRRDENHAVTAQNAAPSAEGDLVLLKPGQVAIDAGRLAKLVEESAQKEAAMGKDGASHHLAELELLARAQKDWYYAMMSYIMGGYSDAEEE